MSSPTRDGTILSSSPVSIRGSSPPRRRSPSPSELSDIASRPRHSPTLTRSYDLNDPQVRERQRTMDVDMAIHLSRARRETIVVSPSVSPNDGIPTTSELMRPTMTILSPHEEHEIDIARGAATPMDLHGDGEGDFNRRSSLIDMPHLNQGHDLPRLDVPRQSTNKISEDSAPSIFGLPTYQANASRSIFDFSLMEDFAATEKAKLGLTASTKFSLKGLRGRSAGGSETAEEGPSDQSPRLARHRKLSQSNANPRVHRKGIGGKMALFESNTGEPIPSLPARFGLNLGGPNMGNPVFENTPDSSGVPPGIPGGILTTGHDRPYRFSFYSNALSATIHARSLSELPADGQSFEDLFTGVSAPHGHSPNHGNRPSSSMFALDARSLNEGNAYGPHRGGPETPYFNTPRRPPSELPKNGFSGLVGDHDDGGTWWLDVQSPTDEEMKMLSKVFSIHPLTTEDIQMEETREKIELFRNYYLVCFRSFDQDPYSPTHLEPLNMYIIVFREGIISFHFRPTPHPQNVRRRIKQLKDYISVTSDWISYALIDDITDAFGPLIQSIEYEVDSIDELVLILKEAEQSDMLRRIGTCRKKVMGLLRLMGNKADVVKGLAKRCNENWRVAPTSDIGLYLSDIQDHLITMTQNLNHYEKILSRSHSNYLAQISIEMTDANNQINDVLSKLTALGTVLIPMNLVTGLWGMNVHVPGQDQEGYAWFISIIACLAAFAAVGGYSTYKFMVRR